MYAQRILADMPMDHHPAPTIADVPLRSELLVPGSEMLGSRRAGCRAVTPDTRIAGMQRAVGDKESITICGVFGLMREILLDEATAEAAPSWGETARLRS